jgi:excisionase family DNA binding protein
MQSNGSRDLLTAAQLAACLEVKRGTVLCWQRQGKIPAHKLSHKVVRFNLREVLAALESRQRPGTQEVES